MKTVALSTLKPYAVELYTEEPLPVQAMTPHGLNLEADDYERLGLPVLAKTYRQLAHLDSLPIGHLLSQEELMVWAWRYPSVYATGVNGDYWRRLRQYGQTTHAWSDLTWPIPPEVRALIKPVHAAYEWIEIWVPELHTVPRPPTISPILVGVRGGQSWLLARWAEALEPYEDIKARAQSRQGRRAWRIRRRYQSPGDPGTPYFALVVSAAVSGLIATLAVCGSPSAAETYWGLVTAAAIFLGVGIPAGWLIRLRSEHSVRWACDYAGWVRTGSNDGV